MSCSRYELTSVATHPCMRPADGHRPTRYRTRASVKMASLCWYRREGVVTRVTAALLVIGVVAPGCVFPYRAAIDGAGANDVSSTDGTVVDSAVGIDAPDSAVATDVGAASDAPADVDGTCTVLGQEWCDGRCVQPRLMPTMCGTSCTMQVCASGDVCSYNGIGSTGHAVCCHPAGIILISDLSGRPTGYCPPGVCAGGACTLSYDPAPDGYFSLQCCPGTP